tara:strand:+ start:595 stop:801 length:207 start_codon:yes stop_codon:yes gene_type:complete
MDGLQLADYILKKNRERQKEIGDILITGGAKDFVHYRELVGEIKGLTFVEQEVQGILKNYEKIDGSSN